uniref:MARVEL domain-containing protein n=1 Tax=Plectus sambesii TaxID=2011161 RepID=A0A914WT57_9BILA
MTTTTNCTTTSFRLSGALAKARNHVLPENRRNELNLGYVKTDSCQLKVIEISIALFLYLSISPYNESALVAPAYTAAAVGICFLINKIARESDNREETTGSLFTELMLVSINAAVFLVGGCLYAIPILPRGYITRGVYTAILLGFTYAYDASMVMRKWNNKDATNQEQPTEVIAAEICPITTTITAEEDVKGPPPTFEESGNEDVKGPPPIFEESDSPPVYFPRY